MTAEHDIPSWLVAAATGLADGDLDAWMAMYADDAVHEFPFAAPGGVRRLEGRPAIRSYMSAVGGSVRFGGLDDLRVRTTGDDLVVEAEGHHADAVSGEPFDVRYVWIITRRGGFVTWFRDYTGPRLPTGMPR